MNGGLYIDGGSSLRLVAVALLLLAAATARAQPAATPDARQEAATRFERGVKLYEAQDYTAALAEFEAAHRLVPRYEVLFNIGVTDKKLFRYNEAVRALGRYLDEGGFTVPRDRRSEVERELQEIRALVAEVAVTVDGGPAAIEVDGHAMGTTPLDGPLFLAPGAHTLRATRAGFEAAERTVDVISGEHVTVALAPRAVAIAPTTASGTLDPGGHDKPPLRWYKRWYPWTIAAVVVVAATGAGVGGYFATRPHYDATITF